MDRSDVANCASLTDGDVLLASRFHAFSLRLASRREPASKEASVSRGQDGGGGRYAVGDADWCVLVLFLPPPKYQSLALLYALCTEVVLWTARTRRLVVQPLCLASIESGLSRFCAAFTWVVSGVFTLMLGYTSVARIIALGPRAIPSVRSDQIIPGTTFVLPCIAKLTWASRSQESAASSATWRGRLPGRI